MHIRDAGDQDSEAIIRLIAGVFSEYPGCVLDVDGEEPHLRRPASAFAEWGGRFWVAEREGEIVACCGCRTARKGNGVELKHLYVAAAARRRGLGSHFVELVEREAAARGAEFVELWSDTRFVEAHRLYLGRGYVQGPQRRLNDLSDSIEHYFARPLRQTGAVTR